MPLEIVRNDITKMNADAIVNSTNRTLIPGGAGVDASIHAAAGPELAEALEKIGECPLGTAVYTEAFGIRQCRYIIHTAGPVFIDGKSGEMEILENCYSSVLKLAHDLGCSSVAVPIISSGVYSYPPVDAYRIATSSVRKFFEENDSEMTVYIVVFGGYMTEISRAFDSKVTQYITDNYVDLNEDMLAHSGSGHAERPHHFIEELRRRERRDNFKCFGESLADDGDFSPDDLEPDYCLEDFDSEFASSAPTEHVKKASAKHSSPKYPRVRARSKQYSQSLNKYDMMSGIAPNLESEFQKEVYVNHAPAAPVPAATESDEYQAQDLSFPDMCLWWCAKKNISPSQFYSRANITRQAFWNIKKHPEKLPKKTTLFACVVGLRLKLDEAEDLLQRAGMTFSKFYVTDAIVKGYIEDGCYNIDDINMALYKCDQTPLGASAS